MRGKKARRVAVAVAVPTVAVAGLGLYWFQPWKLWVDEEVKEELPVAAEPAARQPSPGADATGAPSSPASGPRTVADGELVTHEHRTTGTVRVLRLDDGSHVLRLEGLDTSNGPDLHVWLTDAPVIEGKDGWHVFDDGEHVSLGRLKGNKGDQNYPLPSGVDPADFNSVTIWCDRFDVSFGAAELSV
ncbi:DM13 domain-containing protein [Streptomyces sp. NPDC005931]|uniref:DM13 domain-containing protein n=1 Tax=Streptomyces sp. NPDC005931 TaxID=3364737 RepID=UPI0036B7CA5C